MNDVTASHATTVLPPVTLLLSCTASGVVRWATSHSGLLAGRLRDGIAAWGCDHQTTTSPRYCPRESSVSSCRCHSDRDRRGASSRRGRTKPMSGPAHRSASPHRSGKRTDHGDHEPGLGSHSDSGLTSPVESGVVGDPQRVMMSVLSSATSATRRSTASELASAAGRTNL